MPNDNTNLHAARNTKDDEFYTTMEVFELRQHGFVTRSYDISQILDDIKVLSMNQEDIEDDEFVGNILLGENDELITVQNIKLNSIERYCYMLTANLTGLDKTTKFKVVKWIYVDSNALQYEFFEWLFRIVIKQSNSIHDKIMLTNICESLHNNGVAEKLAQRIIELCELFHGDTHISVPVHFPLLHL